jgi:hypothetical protein
VSARVLRAAAAVAVAFVAGALLNPFSSDATARETPDRGVTAEEEAPDQPMTEETAPADRERNEHGAVEAAAAFICNGQALLDMTADEVDAYLRDRVTLASADRLVEEHLDDLDALRDALSSGVGSTTYRQGVLASRILAFDDEEARVELWHVGVLTRQGIAPPQAGWMISTVDLRWEQDGWKVADEIAIPGPAPILNDSVAPATAEDVLDRLDGFDDFGTRS